MCDSDSDEFVSASEGEYEDDEISPKECVRAPTIEITNEEQSCSVQEQNIEKKEVVEISEPLTVSITNIPSVSLSRIGKDDQEQSNSGSQDGSTTGETDFAVSTSSSSVPSEKSLRQEDKILLEDAVRQAERDINLCLSDSSGAPSPRAKDEGEETVSIDANVHVKDDVEDTVLIGENVSSSKKWRTDVEPENDLKIDDIDEKPFVECSNSGMKEKMETSSSQKVLCEEPDDGVWDDWGEGTETNLTRKVATKVPTTPEKCTGSWEDWSVITEEKVRQVPPPAKDESKKRDPAVLEQQSTSSNSAGWGWGGIVSAVGETFTSTIESSLGLPSATEVAARRVVEKKETVDKDEDKIGNTIVEQLPSQRSADHEKDSTGFGGFSMFSGLVTGGIDVLESIGKKTFEAVTVQDPNSGGRRRLRFEDRSGENLSDVLRELRLRQENEEEQPGVAGVSQVITARPDVASSFERSDGMIHLEALEMLSNNREKPSQSFEREYIAELIGADVENLDWSPLDVVLSQLIQSMGLPYDPKNLLSTDKNLETRMEWLDGKTELELYEEAVQSLVEFTAESVQVVSKLANLLLIAGGGVNRRLFVKLFTILGGRINSIAIAYIDALNNCDDAVLAMNFLKQMATSEGAQSLLSQAGRLVHDMTTSKGPEHEKIEKLSDARLKKMLKLDNCQQFSCHSESTSNGQIYLVVFLPESKVVWKSKDEKAVKQLCKKLDPIEDVSGDKGTMSTKLEKLMAVVWQEPEWESVHYATACGFNQFLMTLIRKDPEVVLGYATADGRFPLNISAEYSQLDTLRLLLNTGAPLTQADATGRTVLHWATASNSTVAVLKELSAISSFEKCLLATDSDGRTPLACAIRAANFEAVKILIGLSAPLSRSNGVPLLDAVIGVLYSEQLNKTLELITTVSPSVVEQPDSAGRTTLHKKLEKQVLMSMLRNSYKHINVNIPDKHGNTPLMAAVDRGEIGPVVALLSYGADVNCQCAKGETALMKALQLQDCISMVKTLLIFDASLAAVNKEGANVMKCAEAARKRVEVAALLKIAQDADISPPPAESANILEDFERQCSLEHQKATKAADRRVNILSLDGGGVRGLVLIQILLEIERSYGMPDLISEFSWLGGTSTGGILALALASGRSLTECRALYFRLKNGLSSVHIRALLLVPGRSPLNMSLRVFLERTMGLKDEIFFGQRPYCASKLEHFLKTELGEKTSMAHIPKNGKRVAVTTAIANVIPAELRIIRSYSIPLPEAQAKVVGFQNPDTTFAWQAARCSSAAPTYFSPVDGRYMDGGLVANNPTCDLLAEVQTYNSACDLAKVTKEKVHLGCVISLGTGKSPSIATENVDINIPQSVFEVFNAVNTLKHLKEMFVEQIACADGVAVSRARSWCSSLSVPFFRFSPRLSRAVDLDETNDVILIDMLWESKVYMATQSKAVGQLVDYFKSFRETTA